MKVTVQHIEQDRNTGAVVGFTDVAEVNVWHTEDVDAALEYAYRYTNNVDGSWSMKIGGDANDDVTVLAPLLVTADGRKMGLRSTSMFDRMVVNGKTYKVDMMGFKEVEMA
jgi:hypothetical protein